MTHSQGRGVPDAVEAPPGQDCTGTCPYSHPSIVNIAILLQAAILLVQEPCPLARGDNSEKCGHRAD